MKHILKCPRCGAYTMGGTCSKCKEKTINPKPAKYSPDDRMGKYRREAKEQERKEKGLL